MMSLLHESWVGSIFGEATLENIGREIKCANDRRA